jgi:hypothetical protein
MDEPELQTPKKEQGIGPVAATVIIVLIVAIGGLYFLYQEHKRFNAPPVEEQLNA